MRGQARDRELQLKEDGFDDVDEDHDLGEGDARRRATLLESQAEELRRRLDGLLDEISRHHRRRPGDLLRRYAVPVACGLLVAGAAVVAFATWRRHRQVVWVRVSGRALSRLERLHL